MQGCEAARRWEEWDLGAERNKFWERELIKVKPPQTLLCCREKLMAGITPRKPPRGIDRIRYFVRKLLLAGTFIRHWSTPETYIHPSTERFNAASCTPASSIFGFYFYLMFLNMSSASRFSLVAFNSGNLGGGLVILGMGMGMGSSSISGGGVAGVAGISSLLEVSTPFDFGTKNASKFNVPELLRLQNSLVVFRPFIVNECLPACGTIRRASTSAWFGLCPLGIGLADPPGDFSSPGVCVPLFLFQNLPPEVLPRLSPKVEAKLGVLGREGSPWEALESGVTCVERRKFNRFRSPLDRRGGLECGVLLSERGEASLPWADGVYEFEPRLWFRGVCGEVTEGDEDREAGKAPGMSRVRGGLGRTADVVLDLGRSGVVKEGFFSSGGGEGGGGGIDVPSARDTERDEGRPGSW